MSKYFLLIYFFLCSTNTYPNTFCSLKEPKANKVFLTLAGTNVKISLADYVRLKPSDFKNITGNKLSLKEMIVLKIEQRRIKKAIRKDGPINMFVFNKEVKKSFKWHWGGFFLGLLLPVLGLIITAFIQDDQRKNRIDSAAIGTCVFAGIFIVIVLNSF